MAQIGIQTSSGIANFGGNSPETQVSTLPTASSSYEGKILQYIGNTTQDYTHGYFYECVATGSTEGVGFQLLTSEPYYVPQFTTIPSSQELLNYQYIQYMGTTTNSYTHGAIYEIVGNSTDDGQGNVDEWGEIGDEVDISGATVVTSVPANPNVGDLIKYMGSNTADCEEGRFYQAATVMIDTYAWVQKNIQPNDGAGHIIIDANGNEMPQRSKVKIVGYRVEDDASNDTTIIAGYKLYGFHHDMSDLNPATCISYLGNTVNANYEPMLTNEGTGTATAGSWANFLTEILKNKPAMVKKDGTLDYWLDPNDYTKKLDGTASDYNNLDYSGAGAFAWIQKAYMKEVYSADGNSRDVYFAFGYKPDDTYFPVGFLCADGELEGVWIPMGYMDASGRTLVAGTTPIASKTCQQEKAIIDTIGTRARFYGGAITNFMRDLMYMLYKHTDIQLRGGHGRCNVGSQQVIANANVTNGNVVGFKGTGNKKTMNKAFHSQLLFSYQQYCRDPYTLLVNGVLKYSDNYEYDISGGTYKIAGDTTWSSLNGGWHYGSHLEKSGDSFGSTPKKENNASTSTGLCDGLYCRTSGVRVALRFGSCFDDLIAGPGCLLLPNEASGASWSYGVGVLLLPPKGYAPAA